MGARSRLVASGITVIVGLLIVAPAAQATFHEMVIREVYPGSTAHPDSGYVELQMYAAGQNLVGTHAVTVYNSAGTLIGTFTFPGNVPNAANQQTILVGDSGVQATFGVTPDLVDSSLSIPASGGAACWVGSIDCVAWGNFTGSTPAAASVGTPVDSGGIPDGMALRRTIAPGCSTLLQATDDSNNSATDFFDATPNPRNNASPITETACAPPPPPPSALIDTMPPSATNGTSASFTYHSSPAGATFECKLDTGPFASCSASGMSYAGPLAEGSHTFQVKATDTNGTGTPASYTWTVDLTPPTASIISHPQDPSPGASASFTYSSNETNSTFQCRLTPVETNFTSCAKTGKTYTSLANGSYTFEVRAIDAAGNQQTTPTAFSWTVDNSVVDTTPPDTTIVSNPPDPSSSSTATFTYESTEPNSTFECKLDAGVFVSCDPSGITYTGLGDGQHTFQVRATDPSNNTDPTPAGYTFSVFLPTPPPPPGDGGQSPPQTVISLKPPAKTHDRTPTFRFRSSSAGATFRCKVDRGAFKMCRSPFTTPALRFGRHTVTIEAIAAGIPDPTPATFRFRVVRR